MLLLEDAAAHQLAARAAPGDSTPRPTHITRLAEQQSGPRVAQRLITSRKTHGVAYTGSVAVGQAVARACAETGIDLAERGHTPPPSEISEAS